MGFTTVTLTGTYATTGGGDVVLQLSAPLTQPSLPIEPAIPHTVALDGAGHFSVALVATNDPATVPIDASYQVTELVTGAPPNTYWIVLPYNAPGGTIDITACQKVLPTPFPDHATVLLESVGRAYGVAELDLNGQVPLDELGNVPGGGGSGLAGALEPVEVVSAYDTEVTASPPSGAATIDGAPVVTGWRVLLTEQTVGKDCGIWIVNTSGDWTRPSDWATGSTPADGVLIPVAYGPGANLYSSVWSLNGSIPPLEVDTDSFQSDFFLVVAGADVSFHPSSPGSMTMDVGGLANFGRLSIQTQINVNGFVSSGAPWIMSANGPIIPEQNFIFLLYPGVTAITIPSGYVSDAIITVIKNESGNSVTVTPSGGETIDGASILTLADKASVVLYGDQGGSRNNWAILASVGRVSVSGVQRGLGMWYPNDYTQLSSISGGGAGYMYASPFIVDSTFGNPTNLGGGTSGTAFHFNTIGAYMLSNGGSGSVVRLGIYADNGACYPGALVVDAGTVASSSGAPANLEISISETLSEGLYWLAIAPQVGTPPGLAGVNIGSNPIFGSAYPGGGGQLSPMGTGIHLSTSVTGAFPNPAPSPPHLTPQFGQYLVQVRFG